MSGQTVEVRPANAASWDDQAAVFGTRNPGSRCFCQRYKRARRESFGGLLRNDRVPWAGRDEDRSDATGWAVTCLVHPQRLSPARREL